MVSTFRGKVALLDLAGRSELPTMLCAAGGEWADWCAKARERNAPYLLLWQRSLADDLHGACAETLPGALTVAGYVLDAEDLTWLTIASDSTNAAIDRLLATTAGGDHG